MESPVAWTAIMAGPWSPIHLAVSLHGVVAVAWLTSAEAFERSLEARLHGSVATATVDPDGPQAELMARAIGAVEDVLAGATPEPVPVDIRDRPDWDRQVLAAVRDIPIGTTASYGEVARRIGRPGAARAAGGAVGRNPITLLIPCHRVIAADGTLGGYGGDGWGGREERLAIKRDLLLREGVTVAPGHG
jgi:methylated-DNA-[protein]-cysteine S-methyltransferase